MKQTRAPGPKDRERERADEHLRKAIHAKLMTTATNVAIALAKLAVTKYEPFSTQAQAVEWAWVEVRESFVAQCERAEQSGFRQDLDELFDNTKLHARTETRVTKAGR